VTASIQSPAIATRGERLKRALFRGQALRLENGEYARAVREFRDALLHSDLGAGDLTVEALGTNRETVSAAIIAREVGVVAGLAEVGFLLGERGAEVAFEKKDGDTIRVGDVLLHAEGEEADLLSLERIGLNLLQRMSGIATAARCLQERAARSNPNVHVVGTRKTLWGLLDKRALHVGSGGTHRLSLGDAILIKNNHLALLSPREEDAARLAIDRAWKFRGESAFIEIEVRTEGGAQEAARAFLRAQAQAQAGEDCPCLVMLDNMLPEHIKSVIAALKREALWDHVLLEASGGISEANLDAYAASGVDAISVGALTHSARALDISQKIS
jgi:nicotinate-nucleotide pyrophosphorylase (carboxylating)